jgi:hypothetical protein
MRSECALPKELTLFFKKFWNKREELMFADAELILCCFLWPNYSDFCLIEVTVSCQHVLKEKIIWHLDEILSWSRMFWWFSPFKYCWSSWNMIHSGCLSMSCMSTGILCSYSYWQNCDSWRCGRSWHFLCKVCVKLF